MTMLSTLPSAHSNLLSTHAPLAIPHRLISYLRKCTLSARSTELPTIFLKWLKPNWRSRPILSCLVMHRDYSDFYALQMVILTALVLQLIKASLFLKPPNLVINPPFRTLKWAIFFLILETILKPPY